MWLRVCVRVRTLVWSTAPPIISLRHSKSLEAHYRGVVLCVTMRNSTLVVFPSCTQETKKEEYSQLLTITVVGPN